MTVVAELTNGTYLMKGGSQTFPTKIQNQFENNLHLAVLVKQESGGFDFNTKYKMRRNCRDKKSYTMYNETLYEVERVIQMKWIKNRQFCLIKWKGYDQRFNTWEPKEHITFCLDYISLDDKKDPEYEKPITTSGHHYHTRAKKKDKDVIQTAKTVQTEEKEDTTFIGEQGPQNPPINVNVKEKQIPEAIEDNLQIRKRGDEWKSDCRKAKDSLVSHILSLSSQKGQQRIARVKMQNGSLVYMYQDILKSRFPEKVIEFYEQKMCKPETSNSD